MSDEEAFSLFRKELVLLGCEENKEELSHLLTVIALSTAKKLSEGRPNAQIFKKFIPSHHKHENSSKRLVPAHTFILKPYPYQETKNPDTIKLLLRLQRQHLKSVAKAEGDDPAFHGLLHMLEDTSIAEEDRIAAEKTVMEAVLRFGEWIGHGDLLTVKMVLEAKKSMSGSATAFERLQFLLGPFRLQMLHMKMKKVSQDYDQYMEHEINFDDVISVPWFALLGRVKVSNKAKDIKKNDSSFELHDQFISAIQESYLLNMFDNFQEVSGDRLQHINCADDVVKYILDMLDYYNIQLFYDPAKEVTAKEGEDDLFIYCQVNLKSQFRLDLVDSSIRLVVHLSLKGLCHHYTLYYH